MGHRLSKIYTRTGDRGTTGLADGSRVDKDDARVEAMGAVDELNSAIGVLLTETLSDPVRDCLVSIQHTLFNLGGELSIPGHRMVAQPKVEQLEQLLDDLNAQLEPLKEFILPGGSRVAAQCHVARGICRRAERRLVTLARSSDDVSPVSLQFINRLSDFLFVLARTLNRAADQPDVLWSRE
jgi:cob(I)alamin adenosyltransferase